MVEFVDADIVEDGDYPSMMVGDVEVPGIYDVSESGGGFTEKYKAEYESRAGGEDTADDPPAAQMTVRAVANDETWEALNNLREQREPFSVEIGEFTYAQMGIVDIQRTIDADNIDTNWIQIQLQEFREIIIAQATITAAAPDVTQTGGGTSSPSAPGGDGGGGGGGGGGGSDPTADLGDPVDAPGDIPSGGGTTNIPANGSPTESPGSGQSFGGEVYDISASGADPSINPTGSNWSVGNIGFSGTYDVHDALMGPNPSGGGNVISNVYFGDGSTSAHTGPTAIWVNNSGSGAITFRNINVQDFGDNGIYASAPMGSAEMHFVECFGQNCGIANFRFGQGTIEDSTSIMDGGYSHSHGGRCIWVWPPGPGEVRNCDVIDNGPSSTSAIAAGDNSSGASTANVYDTEISGSNATHGGGTVNLRQGNGENPDSTPPPIPTSPEQAANGEMSQ